MLEVKTRLVAPALMAFAGIALVGCSASQDGGNFPPPPTTVATANFKLDLATSTLVVPYPYDLYFAIPGAPVDGTLNLPTVPWRGAAMQAAMNSQDGWSNNASLDTSFTLPIDSASISGSSIKIVKLWLNPSTKGPVDVTDPTQLGFVPAGWPLAQGPVAGVLTYGTDFVADISPDLDSGGKILRITPKKPLAFSRGPMANAGTANAGRVLNVGYLVLITDSLKSSDGQTFSPDTLYASLKSAPANCSSITDSLLNKLCQATKAHLSIAQKTGTDPATVILSWSFSTQSIDDTLNYIAVNATAKPALVVPTGLTTKQASSALLGHANIYVGSTSFPYYLTAPPVQAADGSNLAAVKAAVNTKFWTAAGPPILPTLDQASRNLTMFNFAPLKTGDVTVPLLVTIPNASSACAGMPAGGWPVAIVQHGITRNRSDALAIADAFADQCFVMAAIDLPLHGIVDKTNPLYCDPTKPQCIGARERTFDVDFVNNTTGASTPDGKPDSSGAYFINLSSPATGRDNLRQGEADLITFTKSIAGLVNAATQTPVGINPARISFVAQSLGSIVGGSHIHFTNDTATATLSVPGGVLTQLIRDSASLYTPIKNGLNGFGLAPDTYAYNLFFRDFQAILDSADPINHIADATAMHPVFLQKVLNDAVVPNSATDRLIAAGGIRKLKTLGFNNPVGPGNPGYVFFKVGSHGVLFDPSTSLPATMEAQAQAVLFSKSALDPGGPRVPLGLVDASVLDLN